MFGYRASSSSNKKSKLRIFNDPLSEEEREDFLNCASKKEADKYLALSLIQQVNASPLKIQILERWEKQAFKGLENAMHQLQQLNHVWVDTTYTNRRKLYYVIYIFISLFRLILKIVLKYNYFILLIY